MLHYRGLLITCIQVLFLGVPISFHSVLVFVSFYSVTWVDADPLQMPRTLDIVVSMFCLWYFFYVNSIDAMNDAWFQYICSCIFISALFGGIIKDIFVIMRNNFVAKIIIFYYAFLVCGRSPLWINVLIICFLFMRQHPFFCCKLIFRI